MPAQSKRMRPTWAAGKRTTTPAASSLQAAAPTSRGFLRNHTHPGGLIYTDEAMANRGRPFHEAVEHSVSDWVNGPVHTNGPECFSATPKCEYHGVNHRMSPKQLDRFVREFMGRQYDRSTVTFGQIAAIVRGMAGQRQRYDGLIARSPAYPKGLDS